MTIFDDLGAEEERLEKILSGLDEAQWASASAADGWTIADVVLHLAQSEEAAAATATHGTLRGALGAVTGDTTDERADAAVRMERAAPAEVFARWQRARRAALRHRTAPGAHVRGVARQRLFQGGGQLGRDVPGRRMAGVPGTGQAERGHLAGGQQHAQRGSELSGVGPAWHREAQARQRGGVEHVQVRVHVERAR